MNYANELQRVINTLNLIPVTGEKNCDYMLASIRTLRMIQNELAKPAPESEIKFNLEEIPNADDHAE